MLTKYQVAVVQMVCKLSDKQANVEKALHYIEKAVSREAKLVVFPEMFSTGYSVGEMDLLLAESLDGETIQKLLKAARDRRIYIVGGMIEKGERDGTVYNTAFILGPEGIIGKHRKTHLWNMEKHRFLKGEDYTVFQTDIGKIGLQICYEIGFPEGARILSLKGAELILSPSAFGFSHLYAWKIACKSRALENGIYLIASNRTGIERDVMFAGHSRVVSPKGSILANAFDKDEILIAEVNLEQVHEQRKELPYLQDLEKIKVLHHMTDSLSYQY
ncbi:carbon-nitrogen hydrolase family protein [Aneurinibacillus terranovensis]|uniref:carbon-nitrogen hydrolase family protein n=1 Tax=Aneurinibacillus terranovensis TaxID=278991 RepID=UPI0003FA4A25|nr:nitrilase-related carbon-nitrogen hydrolase [Aneurinibacillus terranovensis]